MALAESFTADGAMPSAQLMLESAVAFEAAVFDHLKNGISYLRALKNPPIGGAWKAALSFERSIGFRGGAKIGGGASI